MTAHPLVAELRALRHLLGVRATDIADATGLSLASISHWECGRYVPRLEKFVPYAAAIGFDVTLTPTDETIAADQRTALLTLTAAEVQALIAAASAHAAACADTHEETGLPADAPDPALLDALDRLTPTAPLETTPTRPHRDEPPLTRRVGTVHLPAADIA